MTDHIPMIEKRRIEAAILKEVYDVIKARHGKDEAQEIIRDAVAQSAIAQGREFRAHHDHAPDLADFTKHQHLWEKNNALTREVLHSSPERLDYNITKCAYAEMYKEMGLAEIGPLLSCNRDASFCTGFSEDITLERSQTIMEGASHCDFRYTIKK